VLTIMFRNRRFDTMHGVVVPSKYAMAPSMAVDTFVFGVSPRSTVASGDKIFTKTEFILLITTGTDYP
jgi:hypothetical protein